MQPQRSIQWDVDGVTKILPEGERGQVAKSICLSLKAIKPYGQKRPHHIGIRSPWCWALITSEDPEGTMDSSTPPPLTVHLSTIFSCFTAALSLHLPSATYARHLINLRQLQIQSTLLTLTCKAPQSLVPTNIKWYLSPLAHWPPCRPWNTPNFSFTTSGPTHMLCLLS